jgi:hypothetical protein
MKSSALIALLVLGIPGVIATACKKSEPEPPPQQPYQQYPQQQYPQQQYPQQQPAPAPTPYTPAPQPTATTAPTGASSAGTPTQIPGVMKYPDGTCGVMMPGNPQPMKGPCPPGI